MAAEPDIGSPLRLLDPLRILWFSAWYLPITIYNLLITLQFSTLFDIEAFKSVWFARFWADFGPRSREYGGIKVKPLLHNNARGVCLDIGPGSGQWLYLFAQAMNPNITKIYGVEPNVGMHAELRANAVRAGLGDIYEVVGCGAEDLIQKGGFQPESVDTIITVQCLCSIPNPEANIRELYPLLRPGGVWLVYEHIKTKYTNQVVGYWQSQSLSDICSQLTITDALNIVWPHFIGGCDIARPTDIWLRNSGTWQEINLRPGPNEGPYDTVPHIMGYLKK